jgi:hypothetical protein
VKVKFVGVFGLCLLLVVGLLQIDAIGNPIFHSIAASLRQIINWVLQARLPAIGGVVIVGEPGFLNTEVSQDDVATAESKPAISRRKTKKVERELPLDDADDSPDFLIDSESYASHSDLHKKSEARALQLLHEVAKPQDPVTDLFPETEWYDEMDFEDYDFSDFLTDEAEEVDIPLDSPLDAETVEPLLKEIRSQIQQKLKAEDAALPKK